MQGWVTLGSGWLNANMVQTRTRLQLAWNFLHTQKATMRTNLVPVFEIYPLKFWRPLNFAFALWPMRRKFSNRYFEVDFTNIELIFSHSLARRRESLSWSFSRVAKSLIYSIFLHFRMFLRPFNISGILVGKRLMRTQASDITWSTVVLQCGDNDKPFLWTGASQNSTLRNFVLPGPIVTKLGRLITSATPTHMPIFVKFGSVGNSPQIGEI